MGELRRIHLFGEDIGHERLITALLNRIAGEEGLENVHVATGSARGGHGRALAELKTHQLALRIEGGLPDLLVIAIDSNCSPWAKARDAIIKQIDTQAFPSYVLALPDPHIERWYIADPAALKRAADASVVLTRRKCGRDEYKRLLSNALRAAGHPVMVGGAEFAEEIVAEMDFYRAGKNEPSLRHFLETTRGVFKGWLS